MRAHEEYIGTAGYVVVVEEVHGVMQSADYIGASAEGGAEEIEKPLDLQRGREGRGFRIMGGP